MLLKSIARVIEELHSAAVEDSTIPSRRQQQTADGWKQRSTFCAHSPAAERALASIALLFNLPPAHYTPPRTCKWLLDFRILFIWRLSTPIGQSL